MHVFAHALTRGACADELLLSHECASHGHSVHITSLSPHPPSESNPTVADGADQWLNILQSIQLPFALLPVLHFTSSPKLMGKFANNLALQCVAWGLAVLLISVNVYFAIDFIVKPSNSMPTLFFMVVIMMVMAYIGFIAYLVSWDVREWLWQWRVCGRGRRCRVCSKACGRNDGDESEADVYAPLLGDDDGLV